MSKPEMSWSQTIGIPSSLQVRENWETSHLWIVDIDSPADLGDRQENARSVGGVALTIDRDRIGGPANTRGEVNAPDAFVAAHGSLQARLHLEAKCAAQITRNDLCQKNAIRRIWRDWQ